MKNFLEVTTCTGTVRCTVLYLDTGTDEDDSAVEFESSSPTTQRLFECCSATRKSGLLKPSDFGAVESGLEVSKPLQYLHE